MYRNRLHYSPSSGWMNDPNGFSRFSGSYHLFYQHNPWASKWGLMHWGHATSNDLVAWRTLPLALIPGERYDRDGCYSGTALDDGGRHVLMYTGNRSAHPGAGETAQQVQCIAIGDGATYEKLNENPVIGSDLVPPGCTPQDFRDPKLWKEGGHWYCLVASRRPERGGELLLYRAEELTQWEFLGVAASSDGELGPVWECPDYFSIDQHEVLLWSAQGAPRSDCRFQNGHTTLYSVGTLNRSTWRYSGAPPEELDYGPDFYAPQTLESPDGRRILIAWMQMWGRSIPPDELGHGWAGSMTIPRELEVRDGSLYQLPVRELEVYRRNPRHLQSRIEGEREYPQLRGHYLDMSVTFENVRADSFGIVVKMGGSERTLIRYSVDEGKLFFDRSRSGSGIRAADVPGGTSLVYCCAVGMEGASLELRVVLDRSSCEVFAGGGRRSLSATLYPDDNSDRVAFFAVGGTVEVRCTVWDLAPPS